MGLDDDAFFIDVEIDCEEGKVHFIAKKSTIGFRGKSRPSAQLIVWNLLVAGKTSKM